MTDQEINIAIAEACGWHSITICKCSAKTPRGFHSSFPSGSKHLPSYTIDLNAMHEAENFGIIHLFHPHNYAGNLMKCAWDREPFNATARQRAEAFLRTTGKWKE